MSYYPFNFRLIIYQVVSYRRLKTKEKFKLLVLKVVAVTYERWPLTRGSKDSDLTWKLGNLENWSLRRGECLWEVVLISIHYSLMPKKCSFNIFMEQVIIVHVIAAFRKDNLNVTTTHYGGECFMQSLASIFLPSTEIHIRKQS